MFFDLLRMMYVYSIVATVGCTVFGLTAIFAVAHIVSKRNT